MPRSHGAIPVLLLGLTLLLISPVNAASDTSGPDGIWYLNANGHRLTIDIRLAERSRSFSGSALDESRQAQPLDNITWDESSRVLEFRRVGTGYRQWYRGRIVEGILVGRFSSDSQSGTRPQTLASYVYHVTGWNSSYLDRSLAPRVYEVELGQTARGRLRIDFAASSPGGYTGRFKIYSIIGQEPSGEGLEHDAEVTQWDGIHLKFAVHGSKVTQNFSGTAHGRLISGTYSQTGILGTTPWTGYRAEVLSYGYGVPKTAADRSVWQDRTRRQLRHLMMADDPVPMDAKVTVLRSNLPPLPSRKLPPERDDDPASWPQNYRLSELRFDYTFPDPYGGAPIRRQSHAYLAVPTTPPPPAGKYPAVLAVNGHSGSAWKMMNPDDPTYWYGDAFARRGFVVLALDLSHRPLADRKAPFMSKPLYSDRNLGDDPAHGNGPHPAIKPEGFDSDWEEDGERAWDARRALDYLLSLPNVGPDRVAITGLSMGGEVATIVAGLDTRIALAIPAGFSADLGVMLYHGNHPCWRWINSDIREYIDTADIQALIAPRPLIVETGKVDFTYSRFIPPFAGDKQVLRRARVAYAGQAGNLIHYLHYDAHHYHVGDTNPARDAERDVRTPEVVEPTGPWSTEWQTNGGTEPHRAALFDFVAFYLRTR